MKLLVTGGTGFIGSRLAVAARAGGHDVVIAGQLKSVAERDRARELESAGIRIEQGPLQDPDFAARICAGRDGVIHLAAAQHEANVAETYFYDVNVTGTRTLLEASVRSGVRRFTYGSTIGVYGEYRGAPLDEDSPPAPQNAYGRSKLEAEELVRSYRDRLEVTIVRISETYGPGDYRLLKLYRAIDRGRFMVLGSGNNLRQVIYVDDLVRGLLIAARSPAAVGETFVMAGGETVTTLELIQAVATALGRRPSRRRVPMWPFLIAAVAMECTLRPLGIQPPLHRRRLDFFRKSFVLSSAKARSVLGFAPSMTLAAGSCITAAWYRQKGLLASP